MVLGGDIFDFKWSTRSSLEHSIADSIDWLEKLIVSHPNCEFYYVLGNHDAHPKFVAELDRLAFRQPRLSWHPFLVRLHQCVFLHGDVVDCEPSEDSIVSRRKAIDQKPRPVRSRHWLYDAVVRARLHRVAGQIAIRRSTVLKKISLYLSMQGLNAENGIRDVYFGHTHRDIDGVEYRSMTFHNGGASIKGLSFRIIETRLPTITKPSS